MNKGLENIISSDKFPYLLTLLFAGLSFVLSHLISEIEKWHLVEYQMVYKGPLNFEGRRAFMHSVIVKNVTNSYLFDDLKLIVDYQNDSGDSILDKSMAYIPPAHFEEATEVLISNLLYQVELKNFQPGWEVELSVLTTGEQPPVVRSFSEKPMYLRELSIITWAMRNKIPLLLTILICWIMSIVVYLFLLARISEESRITEEDK